VKRFVIVSGDFTTFGGMDRANYELAWHLAERCDAQVHLVAFNVQPPLAEHRNVTWHRVNKPLNSYLLGEGVLDRAGRRVAREMTAKGARVIVNGGNCCWPDVNWIHALHAAWDCRHAHAPLAFRARARWQKRRDRHRERAAVRSARLVITNSDRTRRQAIELLALDQAKVQTVHYGIDGELFRRATSSQKHAARAALSLPVDRPVIAFIGTLGHDRNKGFDTLFEAHASLCESRGAEWDPILVAAGAGRDVKHWQNQIARRGLTGRGLSGHGLTGGGLTGRGLSDRVRMLGFTKQIPDLLAAADLVVAPSSYESYGMAVHEALCREIPAIVSNIAGVAERYPPELSDLLLPNPTDARDLAAKLSAWHAAPSRFREPLARFAQTLRAVSWSDMASRIVQLIDADGSLVRQSAHQSGVKTA
jgi:glycosyltransferase involved in cell wall biosynthesis